jgi:hypothetical protein
MASINSKIPTVGSQQKNFNGRLDKFNVQLSTLMNNKTISSSQARKQFFQILDQVFNHDQTFIIQKSGIPVAQLSKPEKFHNVTDLLLEVLNQTKGSWGKVALNNKKRKIELTASKKRKKKW